MEKKRKRMQNSDTKEVDLVSSSTSQKMTKTVTDQQEKDKTINYPAKPHMLFR